MKRVRDGDLVRWAGSAARKPLVVRGARQVGKSWLVREFGRSRFGRVVELNFEREPTLSRCFTGSDPHETVRRIENVTGALLRPDASNLLFLDELQAAPTVLAKLRWFAEELPRLPVIATGSLLDFALAEPSFSMPVGRITFLHLEPLGFLEFCDAIGEARLAQRVRQLDRGAALRELAGPVHEKLSGLFRDYLLVGGMPAVVETWVRTRSWSEVAAVQRDLVATLRADFGKYSNLVHHRRLESVFASVPQQLGQAFSYVRADRGEQAKALRNAVELLCLARVCHRVAASPALRPPLEAGVSERHFKLLFLDAGLASAGLGLGLSDLDGAGQRFAHEGGLAEQAVGQLLRLSFPANQNPALHFWRRGERGSEAEIDYVIQLGSRLVPIEVKAGATGTLKSLHALMAARGWPLAVRFWGDRPDVTPVAVKTSTSRQAKYELLSLPHYLAEVLPQVA